MTPEENQEQPQNGSWLADLCIIVCVISALVATIKMLMI